MNQLDRLSIVRRNPRLMRESELQKSGLLDFINSFTSDDSFAKFKLKEKIDFVLSGAVDVWCPYCKVGRVKPGSTYCCPACTGKANKELLSQKQKANAPERMRKTKETMLSRYGVAHNTALEHCKEARSIKRAVTVANMYRDTFDRYGLDYELFNDKDHLKKIASECFSLTHLSANHFNGMPIMTILRHYLRCEVDHGYDKTSSQGEREMTAFVKSLGFAPIANDRTVIPPGKDFKYNLEIDCWVESKGVGFEYHGLWCHTGDVSKTKHKYKHDYMLSQGYKLVQIFEDEWVEKRSIVENIIRMRLGSFDRTIHARKCELRAVEPKEARAFLDANHIQGAINGTHFGLYYEGSLTSMITVGKSRFKNKDAEYELLRQVSESGTTIPGGFDRLLKAAYTHFGIDSMVTYCDNRLFSGDNYARRGELLRTTEPGYFWVDSRGLKRIGRHQTQKHRLGKLLGDKFDATLSERENMENAGYIQIWDVGQSVFLLKA